MRTASHWRASSLESLMQWNVREAVMITSIRFESCHGDAKG